MLNLLPGLIALINTFVQNGRTNLAGSKPALSSQQSDQLQNTITLTWTPASTGQALRVSGPWKTHTHQGSIVPDQKGSSQRLTVCDKNQTVNKGPVQGQTSESREPSLRSKGSCIMDHVVQSKCCITKALFWPLSGPNLPFRSGISKPTHHADPAAGN